MPRNKPHSKALQNTSNPLPPVAGRPTVSLRENLRSALVSECYTAGFPPSEKIIEATCFLVDALGRYQEEGKPLFPEFIITTDIQSLLKTVPLSKQLPLKSGSTDIVGTARKAIKHCAPLAREGWVAYLEISSDQASYGLARAGQSESSLTIRESLLLGSSPTEVAALYLTPTQRDCVLIHSTKGPSLCVRFTGHHTIDASPLLFDSRLIEELTQKIPSSTKASATSFWERFLTRALRTCHGTLIGVVARNATSKQLSIFSDGLWLPSPVDLGHALQQHLRDNSAASSTELSATSTILEGMLASDGITLLTSDSKAIAFNVFLRTGNTPPSAGGARRRAYEAMSKQVGRGLSAAFFLSQDGHHAFIRR